MPIPAGVLTTGNPAAGHDWQRQHWGCRGGAEDAALADEWEGGAICEFATAWTPPLAFLEHLTTGERSLDFAMTVPGHLLPPLESVRKLVPSYKSDFMSKHGEWVTTLLKLAPNAQNSSLSMGSVNNQTYEKISNICPWGAQIWNSSPIDGALFQEILINKKDPEAAWIAASAQLKAAADKWKQENPSWKPLA